jgi:autotransporter passenger strand-loop-strand repeat protein
MWLKILIQRMILVSNQNHAVQESHTAMNDPMLPLPGLSPVAGKKVVVKFDGGLLSSDVIKGIETILSGGMTMSTAIASGAYEVVWFGGTASATQISSGGTLEVFSGATLIDPTFNSGGKLELGSGASDSGEAVASGFILEVASGGTAIDTVLGD